MTAAAQQKQPRFAALTWLRDRLRNRPDSEHEQALLRLAIGVIASVYIVVATNRADGAIGDAERYGLALVTFFVPFCFAMLVSIVLGPPRPSVLRRFLGIVVDVWATTYVMFFLEGAGSPVYGVYLWITFGNGFRYGPRYLYVATALSVVGFAFVLATSQYWSIHRGLGVGLLIALVVLPMYVATLVKKLNAAVQRAEEASRAKSQFLANMSHEMRTPLNGVIGMSHLLSETPLNAEQKDFAKTIHTSARALLTIVEDVLDISKIEAGKVRIEVTDFDLHALINSTATMLAPQARAKDLEFVLHIAPEVPFRLRGDPTHLHQTLVNLLGNAVKFTEKGEVELRVVPCEQSDTKARLRFEVIDTGIGIPQEAQARIFEAFTQADESTTRRFGGTGLGTTIAKQLVELMGGAIGFESTPGIGTTFWFEVPFEVQTNKSRSGLANQLAETRVLLVSAKPEENLLEHLRGWAVDCVTVGNAAQAFAHLLSAASRQQMFHAVLVDQAGLDVYPTQFAAAMRADPALGAISLLLLRTEDDNMDRARYLHAGYACVLDAPLRKPLLFNALHAVSVEEHQREGVIALADHRNARTTDRRRPGLRILVAEDNAVNQKVIHQILGNAGHHPLIVSSGEQALDALEAARYDLVILDKQMPGMGGIEVMKTARFLNRGKMPPTIILTADATTEAQEECRRAGADAYLTKPVEPRALLDNIASLVPSAGKTERKHASSEEGDAPLGDGRQQIAPKADVVLDEVVLANLEMVGRRGDFVRRLVHSFAEDTESLIRGMRQALEEGRGDEFRDHAHSLKGSAGSIGARALQEIAAHACRLSNEQLAAERAALMRRLVAEFEAARNALHAYLGRKDSAAG
jgi:two-component system sensor histidine kinase RpfC